MFDRVHYPLGEPVLYDWQTVGPAEPEKVKHCEFIDSRRSSGLPVRCYRHERLVIASSTTRHAPLRRYLNRADSARKNSAGLAMRSDVR